MFVTKFFTLCDELLIITTKNISFVMCLDANVTTSSIIEFEVNCLSKYVM